MSPQRRAAILAGAAESARMERTRTLHNLHGSGHVLRARIGECQEREASLPSGMPEDIARWEAEVHAEFAGMPLLRDRLDAAPQQDQFAITAGGAYDRIDYQLQVLEMIIRSLDEG